MPRRLALLLSVLLLAAAARAEEGSGVVFHDRDGDGKRGAGEEGLSGVRVSNQREIVATDAEGRWRLPVREETIFFVIKPRGWMTAVDRNRLPRFYYNHKPKGSPPLLRHRGVKPTGALPPSIDFPLVPQEEPDRFRAVFFGDTQPRDLTEVDYLAHDLVEELIGTDARFGVTLGDLTFGDLSLFVPQARAIALIGLPWYNVIGNHDVNADAAVDRWSDETFERVFGPPYYSFDWGPTHFVVLDDVVWEAEKPGGRPRLRGGFGPDQLEFVRNDLAGIPPDQLVVLLMHIPLNDPADPVRDREELFRLIEQRPHALSVSAHRHYQSHEFLGAEDGWRGAQPHHHLVNVTACGSWWKGARDAFGIPHATMSDGAPNGYSLFTFDGTSYTIEFKAARGPADWQMNVYAPDSVKVAESAGTEVLVNVFGGSERSTVEMRLDRSGEWTPLEKVVLPDPQFAQTKQAEDSAPDPRGRSLPSPTPCHHLWRGTLPEGLAKGMHGIEVRTTDMFGHAYRAWRALRVE